jgi:hypothetical protein
MISLRVSTTSTIRREILSASMVRKIKRRNFFVEEKADKFYIMLKGECQVLAPLGNSESPDTDIFSIPERDEEDLDPPSPKARDSTITDNKRSLVHKINTGSIGMRASFASEVSKELGSVRAGDQSPLQQTVKVLPDSRLVSSQEKSQTSGKLHKIVLARQVSNILSKSSPRNSPSKSRKSVKEFLIKEIVREEI